MISVVITTKNEAKHIVACVESFRPFLGNGVREVIVVDNFSTDGTDSLAVQHGAKVLHLGPERSAQRNAGVEKARGTFVFVVDADMIVPEATMKELIRACRHKLAPDAIYVREVRTGEGWWIRVRNFERSFYDATCIDCVRVIRRSLFLELGGFDTTLCGVEDWDFDLRLRQKTNRIALTLGHLLHNEGQFTFARHFKKKTYYANSFDLYRAKWPKNPDVRRQFGIGYRFFGVFLEKGKWLRVLRHPLLFASVWVERICVAVIYLRRKRTET